MITLSLNSVVLFMAITANVFLLLVVYWHDRKSATNKSYAALSFVMSVWLVAAFFSVNPETNLLWARLTVFFATLMSMLFFLLSRVLPARGFNMSRWAVISTLLATFSVMALTLTPLTFRGIDIVDGTPELVVGPGIAPFAILTTFFTLAAIVSLFRKMRRTSGAEKKQSQLVLTGIALMVGLIILTVMIPVVLFQNDFFVAFTPIYAFFFLGMTAYAIVKYKLFDLKVIATEAFTVILWILLLSRVVISESLADTFVGSLIFVATVVFGILLIKSVRKEVEQRRELEELSRFKSQLLSLVSHQIKSPLAAIKGFATILLEGIYGAIGDKPKATIQKMKTASDELLNLVNMLLDLRQVEEGKLTYEFARTDFKKLAEEAVSGLKPLAVNKGLKLEFESTPDEVWVNADAPKLKQVIQNLVDNAIKYTPKGFVKVELSRDKDGALLIVSDSGLGISPTLMPHIFEEFVRDERVKREIRGTGLGLYIAKRLVEAHQGKIWVESEGEGKGSKFYLRLESVPAPLSGRDTG